MRSGGAFSSRLFTNVRSKKGLAYYVGGGIGTAYDHPGVFQRRDHQLHPTCRSRPSDFELPTPFIPCLDGSSRFLTSNVSAPGQKGIKITGANGISGPPIGGGAVRKTLQQFLYRFRFAERVSDRARDPLGMNGPCRGPEPRGMKS